MLSNESTRHLIYLLYAIVCAVGAVVCFIRGLYVEGGALVALIIPTGLAASNTSR